ncbi:hypothetical protein NHX12_032446 [Muraenolepis orangiensis]|uniref:Brain-specific angiogenesis inhibitor 1-associated protein 2-like protein 2 n=1 Tax=Muraenolepis orangiensis TaxID=630683 RepID=A0A9Q0E7U4_9TELE|nr:hypothetical protein NHX12_032446 [Muraenolepis orangiensis]
MLSPHDVQLHRATLEIYSSLLDQLNPSLQKLVSLGNSYVQAFYALATTSEAYFKALAKIGEQASYSKSSGSIGRVLIQISEEQRRLSTELEGVFRLHAEVLQDMDHHVRLDKDYISDECEYLVRRSHGDALKEEERRYRFLAEKHCDVTHAAAQVMNKTAGVSQQKVEVWQEQLNATRRPEVSRREEEMSLYREEMPLGRVPSRAPSPVSMGSRSNSMGDLTGPVGGGGGSGGSGGGGGGGRRTMRALATHHADPSRPTLLGFQRGEVVTAMISQPRNGWLYGQAQTTARQGWFPAAFVEAVDQPPKAASSYRGTNPFATVKLKQTSTNDKSAPRLHRR